MAILVQIGVGSGGIVVLDAVARDPRIHAITLIDPDVYEAHNTARHIFPTAAAGTPKVTLAAQWLKALRPDLTITPIQKAIQDQGLQDVLKNATFAICAADNEPAKYECNRLFLEHKISWTLGEVLSGGIAGWVHRLVPGGPCYGCVSSYLMRTLPTTQTKTPVDYSTPEVMVAQARVPASKAAITTVAGLHAVVTLDLLNEIDATWTSTLLALARVPGVFEQAPSIRTFSIPKDPACLCCHADYPKTVQNLDAELEEALARVNRA